MLYTLLLRLGRSRLGRSRRDGTSGHLGHDLVEFSLADHPAVAVELGIELHLQTLDVQVAFDGAAALQGKGVLDIEIAVHRSVEVDVLADDVALDLGLLPHDDAALGADLALEDAVDAEVGGSGDLTLESGTGGNPAHFVHIDRFHCFSHILLLLLSRPGPCRGSSCT